MGFWDGLVKGIGKIAGAVLNAATGGIGSAVGSIVGDAIGSLVGKSSGDTYQQQLDAQLGYQKQLIDYQNQQTREQTLWNNEQTKNMMQYQYDNFQSPAAIMKNYQAAGINPNLVAGQVSGSGSGSAVSAVAQSGSGGSAAASYNHRVYQASTALELESLRLKNEEQRLLNEKLEKESPYWSDNARNVNMLGREQVNEIVARINSMHIADNKTVEEINEIMSRTALNKDNALKIKQEVDNIRADSEVKKRLVLVYAAQAALMKAQELKASKEKDYIVSQVQWLNGKIADMDYLRKNGYNEIQSRLMDLNKQITEHEEEAISYTENMQIVHDLLGFIAGIIPAASGFVRAAHPTPRVTNVNVDARH